MLPPDHLSLTQRQRDRLQAIRLRLRPFESQLETQGSLVRKRKGLREVWCLRIQDRSGDRPVQRNIYIGRDPEVVEAIRQELSWFKLLHRLARGFSRISRASRRGLRQKSRRKSTSGMLERIRGSFRAS